MDIDPRTVAETGAAALLFAAVFLVGGRFHPLRALTSDRRSLVSFAAGMSAAYVFVRLMPEMHSARTAFAESVSLPLPHEGKAIYFLGLIGFLGFYGLERLRAHLRRGSESDNEARAFRVHLGGFAAYVALMSYLLVRNLEGTATATGLYAAAIGAHFLALEHSLREEHGEAWQRVGRWVLAAMCLLGWGAGLMFALPHHTLALLVAFVSGAVIMTSAAMELPTEKDGRFLPFLAGGLVYLTPLGLAQDVIATIEQLARIDIKTAPPAYHTAQSVAADLEKAVRVHFGEQAPAIVLVDRLSANALATSRQIKVRSGARFTDRDFVQLLHHEAYIHVATSLNGQAQTDLPILGAGHPGTTRTQEGLAVFAELISGSIELDRLRRLADRVLTIQMAIDGADFLEVYRFFLDRTGDSDQSFESARRVFRGGVITGGAPFCKDLVYLFGLLQVHNFIRASFAAGRADCLSLLFCGKLDLFDIPALCELYEMGLCKLPQFLPPWISDPRYLLAVLTFNVFTSHINLGPLVEVAKKILERAPLVRMPASSAA